MIVTLDPKLEAALREQALREGVPAEELALQVLRARILPSPLEARDEWERGLLESARPWGITLPDAILTSEGLYN